MFLLHPPTRVGCTVSTICDLCVAASGSPDDVAGRCMQHQHYNFGLTVVPVEVKIPTAYRAKCEIQAGRQARVVEARRTLEAPGRMRPPRNTASPRGGICPVRSFIRSSRTWWCHANIVEYANSQQLDSRYRAQDLGTAASPTLRWVGRNNQEP